jgi:glycine hydroxymethyltransferase
MNSTHIASFDPQLHNAIQMEFNRQQNQIELIASENITSKAIMEAQGSVLTNKYAEGYPDKRYYNGCEYVDIAEQLAIDRAKQLFNCEYVNVQPHSGASANFAVYYAFLQPNDTVLGMSLDCGGHLTHGMAKNFSGKWFNAVSYGVDSNGQIDYNDVEAKALECKPKMIIAGFSAYTGILDWKKFREIADKVGAILMVDMAHIAGLVAGGSYPSPVPFADVVTSTTHKTMRGPRGGLILAKTNKYEKELNSAVFPGTQGGPLMHVIAAKAIMFKEALQPDFANYAHQVVKNAKALATRLQENGINLVGGGTECHIVLLNLTSLNITGKDGCNLLEICGITANKNAIPNDTLSPFVTSGIRLGAPACTTRGFKEQEFIHVADIISQLLHDLSAAANGKMGAIFTSIMKAKYQVEQLCGNFPIYK